MGVVPSRISKVATCAAGLAGLNVIEQEGLLDRVQQKAPEVLARMDAIAENNDAVRRARGLGYMLAFACRDPETATAMAEGCIERGVLVTHSGMHGDTVRIIPPLNMSDEEWDVAFSALEESAAAAS